MNICSDNHDEIAYEGGYRDPCPLCNIIEEKEKLEREISQFEEYTCKSCQTIERIKE